MRVAILIALLAAACGRPAPADAPQPIRIASAVPGGSPFNRTLADVYAADLPGVAPAVVRSEGVVESLEMVERNQADLAYTFTNVAYAAVGGQLPGHAAPFTRLRAVALLQPAALHVLVGRNSPAREIDDLRGRSLKFSGPGAALLMTVQSVLPAFGDGEELGAASVVPDGVDSAELLDGQIDALLVLGQLPVAQVQQAIAAGARLLPATGDRVERLLLNYPFYRDIVIPVRTYEGLAAPVATIGVNAMLVCRADLPEDVVYRLTQALYNGPAGVHPQLGRWLEPAAGPATPIPLHPGAARYYRERELSP
jgi:hypothetical protein